MISYEELKKIFDNFIDEAPGYTQFDAAGVNKAWWCHSLQCIDCPIEQDSCSSYPMTDHQRCDNAQAAKSLMSEYIEKKEKLKEILK